MSKLIIHETPLKGLYEVETTSSCNWFSEDDLIDVLGNRQIRNVNFSRTLMSGSIRGMHFQRPPYAEMKMVRCIKGKVFDVAVDLRKNSPSYLQWYGIELSEKNMKLFVIPEGFAHGFQTLVDDVEMLYLHTEYYHKDSEGGVRYNDPSLSIQWPIKIADISERDATHPLIDEMFSGMIL